MLKLNSHIVSVVHCNSRQEFCDWLLRYDSMHQHQLREIHDEDVEETAISWDILHSDFAVYDDFMNV